jgi:23S rRNA (cytosine1962-C5)-methyltransferase
MTQDKYTMFSNRLAKVYAHRRKKARQQGVSCYRLYDLDLPEFPLAIDLYEDHVHAAEYKRKHTLTPFEHAEWLTHSKACIAGVLGIEPSHIHVKQREVIKDRQQQYNKFASEGERQIVSENGLRFYVNLTDYLDTGLFLDHRPTRALVRERCRNLRVLNLFAYTGAFSVYAAAGGASKVTTVDMSNTYIEWAKDNFRLNGFALEPHEFVAANVLEYLPTLEEGSMDLIICDPPTFSNSKKMQGVFDVQRDHPALINECLRLLSTEGVLYFSTNQRRFRLYDEHLATDNIKDITRETTGFDFEGKLERYCFELRPGATQPVHPAWGGR